MKPSGLTGNDVIDTNHGELTNKLQNTKFMQRVFTVGERCRVEESADPHKALWQLWTAKEAAYKVIKKHDPKEVFVHKNFAVDEVACEVSFKGLTIPVKWAQEGSAIHCVALWGEDTQELWPRARVAVKALNDPFFSQLSLEGFSALEKESIHTQPSLCVRALCKHLLLNLGFNDTEIIRKASSEITLPPQVFVQQTPLEGVDVSLSHHGEWVAVSVLALMNSL